MTGEELRTSIENMQLTDFDEVEEGTALGALINDYEEGTNFVPLTTDGLMAGIADEDQFSDDEQTVHSDQLGYAVHIQTFTSNHDGTVFGLVTFTGESIKVPYWFETSNQVGVWVKDKL